MSALSSAYRRYRSEIIEILDERFYPIEWVDQQIAAGRIGLMENDAAIIGVERKVYPGGAVELHGMFAAGELNGILELIDLACEAGRKSGCTIATIASRAGWSKVLRSRGFEVRQQVISKELSDGPI